MISGRHGGQRHWSVGEARRRRRVLMAAAGAAALLFALGASPARAGDSTAVASFGLFGAEEGENRAAVLDLEYRFPVWHLGIGPVLGMAATSDGGAYLRAGLGRDFPFGKRWNANVSVAAAGYERGHGKQLGRGFEFRSAFDLSYQVQPGVRIGGAVAHLSNAGIGEHNPGVETFTLTIAFTPRRMVILH